MLQFAHQTGSKIELDRRRVKWFYNRTNMEERTMRNGLVEIRKTISASREGDEAPRAAAARAAPLSRGVILLLAFTCGLSVANVYFAHPLLDIIARDFKIAGSGCS